MSAVTGSGAYRSTNDRYSRNAPSPRTESRNDACEKSSCSNSDRSDACVCAVEYCSPPPLASARFVNASMCRASSTTCVDRNITTSVNCGWIRG